MILLGIVIGIIISFVVIFIIGMIYKMIINNFMKTILQKTQNQFKNPITIYKCINCNHLTTKNNNEFCMECGFPLDLSKSIEIPHICPGCNEPVEFLAKCCGNCGKDLNLWEKAKDFFIKEG